MNRPSTRILALLILGLLGTAVPAEEAPPPPDPPELAAETFDAAWKIVYETHPDPDLNGVDWLALREELRPKAVEAESVGELRSILSDMLERLQQSHFALIPHEAVDVETLGGEGGAGGEADVGLELRAVEDRLVVYRVAPDRPAARAGIRPGWTMVGVDEDRTEDWVESIRENPSWHPDALRLWSVGTAVLMGDAGSTVNVAFLDGDDTDVTVGLEREKIPGETVKLGNLPPFRTQFGSREIAKDGIDVGLIEFNFWMVPLMPQIDGAINRYRGKDGMVIDLRGNGGGVGGMTIGISGHFLDSRVTLGTTTTRTQTIHIRSNPRRVSPDGERVEPFSGPLAILIDGVSGSASEMFAGGMQDIGRARVFGQSTMGAVLPAIMDRLPNGDVLYHAFGDFTTASGVRLEGRGVIPDEFVPLTREDLLAGRDATLDAALAWIATEVQSAAPAAAAN